MSAEMSDFDEVGIRAVVRFMVLLDKDTDQIEQDLITVLGDQAPDREHLEELVTALREKIQEEREGNQDDHEDASGDADDTEPKYEFEHQVLDDTVMKDASITHSAIISFEDGKLRAAAPSDFEPNETTLKHIVEALKGDTSGIAVNGINFGSGTKMITPAKIDEGSFIYGSDAEGGGCSICKSKICVLILVYARGPSHATRMAREVAEYMEDSGH